MAADPFDRLRPHERDRLAAARGAGTAAMLATLTDDRFSDPEWIYERKLDGVRCLAHRTPRGSVALLSRNDLDMSRTYPQVAAAVAERLSVDAVLDGEVVAFDGRRTSFERLQGAGRDGVPVYYYVFDVLQLAGRDVRALPLLTRKGLLRDTVDFTDPLRYAQHRRREGERMFREACERGDEGVVAKRADAPYTSGRSKDWLKFKCVRDQEFVVGGWTDPRGSRTDFGALLLGYYADADFVYAGKVGTGFTAATLRAVAGRLAGAGAADSPFTGTARIRERDVHWVRPEVVVQIGFTEWTRDGLLRHPRFTGIRIDKAARDVVRET